MRGRIPFVAGVLMWTAGSLLSPLPTFAESFRLRPGFQRIIDFAEPKRVSIGNPEIIEARPLPHRDGILVVGKHPGETDLVVWGKGEKREWTVTVSERMEKDMEESNSIVALFPGLSVSRAGSAVIISGTVPTARDKELLESFALPRKNVHLRVSLPEDRNTLLSYDLKILEISKGAAARLGVRWPDSLSAKGSWSRGSSDDRTFRVASDFEARLDLLMADGRARILANPKLVCESGGSADFLAGGEIPIVIVTPETRTVEWKTYGIILKLQPSMKEGDRIRTHLSAEISTVDHGGGGSDVPGFLTRRITTDFTTHPGGTVMLSGLIKSETAKDVAKVPLLGQIP
ncbi:MAG TPA: pilus assembly protein N-terminal domain-containing protein, partial [Candidatus Aquicultoraceae bacterium]|nr:pilus assembly protein N-terminal domain-containing protein [Candidatus Aquicultoraceae bacterium]